jgi:hypothetical protein
MSSVSNTDDLEIVKRSDGACWNAFVQHTRGGPIVAEQGSQQIGRHPAVAHYGYRAAGPSQAEQKYPQAFSRRPRGFAVAQHQVPVFGRTIPVGQEGIESLSAVPVQAFAKAAINLYGQASGVADGFRCLQRPAQRAAIERVQSSSSQPPGCHRRLVPAKICQPWVAGHALLVAVLHQVNRCHEARLCRIPIASAMDGLSWEVCSR